MSDERDFAARLQRSVGSLPVDLAAVVGFVVAANLFVFAPVLSATPLRIGFGVLFALFVPGYALVAALFPEANAASSGTVGFDGDGRALGDRVRTSGGIDGIERAVLAVGFSVAVVPLIGLALNFTPFGIRLVPVAVCISAFTVGTAAIAAGRRRRLPAGERFTIPYDQWLAGARSRLFEPDSRLDGALDVLLAVSLVLAATSVGYALVVPADSGDFSEFYLLTGNESGELTATDYPTNFTQGESESLVVGVDNHEGEPVRYTILVSLQRVETTGNETRVLERSRLYQFDPRVGANGTWTRTHRIEPSMTGERLRLTYLLYRGAPPAEPTTENAYRELHLWVNVTGGG